LRWARPWCLWPLPSPLSSSSPIRPSSSHREARPCYTNPLHSCIVNQGCWSDLLGE
jgi:hypothetical protein